MAARLLRRNRSDETASRRRDAGFRTASTGDFLLQNKSHGSSKADGHN
jgi:hypothetical protein